MHFFSFFAQKCWSKYTTHSNPIPVCSYLRDPPEAAGTPCYRRHRFPPFTKISAGHKTVHGNVLLQSQLVKVRKSLLWGFESKLLTIMSTKLTETKAVFMIDSRKIQLSEISLNIPISADILMLLQDLDISCFYIYRRFSRCLSYKP